MSKLLAVLISFAFVVTSLTAHAVVPVSAVKEADFSKSHAIYSCHEGTLFSALESSEKTSDKNLLPSDPHHCLLDFVIVMAPTSNRQMPTGLRETIFLQKQLNPTSPEHLGKPPKA